MPPAHTAAPTTTSPHTPTPPSTIYFPQSSAPCTVTAGAGKPREEAPQSSVPRSPVPQSTVPPTPTPVTSPSAAPTFHAYICQTRIPKTHTPYPDDFRVPPHLMQRFPQTTPLIQRISTVLSHTMAPHNIQSTQQLYTFLPFSPATLYTSNADPTPHSMCLPPWANVPPHSKCKGNETHLNRFHNSPPCKLCHTNASLAYPNHHYAGTGINNIYNKIPHPFPPQCHTRFPPQCQQLVPTTTRALALARHLLSGPNTCTTSRGLPRRRSHQTLIRRQTTPSSRSVVPSACHLCPLFSFFRAFSSPVFGFSPVSSAPHSSSSAATLAMGFPHSAAPPPSL
ncbi:mucin-2-like [Penaeus monodon]|uniref:mucin-2-like n=1 Tax=Penaeus monodon TaxID=6687 RepID=UPI0018A7492D|nr:mucin-2-like [Penaeus monodon]